MRKFLTISVASLALSGCGPNAANVPEYKLAQASTPAAPARCYYKAKPVPIPKPVNHSGDESFNEHTKVTDLYDREAARWDACRKFLPRGDTK